MSLFDRVLSQSGEKFVICKLDFKIVCCQILLVESFVSTFISIVSAPEYITALNALEIISHLVQRIINWNTGADSANLGKMAMVH